MTRTLQARRLLYLPDIRLPLADAMRKQGWQIHVATPDDPLFTEFAKAATPHNYFRHKIPYRRTDWRCFFAIAVLILRLRPTLIHLIGLRWCLYGGLAARALGIPCVYTVTGLGAAERAWWLPLLRWVLRTPRCAVIYQNHDDENDLDVSGSVIRTGVDLEKFPYSPEPDNQPPIVLFPNRLVVEKGVREFVKAAELLKGRARFVLVGLRDIHNPNAIPQAELDGWLREGIVEYEGFCTNMAEVIARANIVCLPSYREGLPRVLLEAAAIGRAIVTTDVPGCRDVIRANRSGILIQAKRSLELADAIARLLRSKEMRYELSIHARHEMLRDFSMQTYVADTLKVYAAVAGRSRL